MDSSGLGSASASAVKWGRKLSWQLKRLASSISGTCTMVADEDAAENMSMDRRTADILDALRKKSPSIYASLSDASARLQTKAVDAQPAYLRFIADTVMAMASRT